LAERRRGGWDCAAAQAADATVLRLASGGTAMPKHLIFLVHGMGRYGVMENGEFKPDLKGWFEEATAALKDSYKTFVEADMGLGVAFDDRFTIVPVVYDGIFDKIRTAWAEQAEGWSQLGLGGDGFIESVQGVLKSADEDDFLWTHAADVALYAIPLVRDAVKMRVISIMLDKLSEVIGEGPFDTWSIVAHSLGTAVVHDSLLLLQHRALETFPNWLPPRSLCMVANVARALSNNDATAYDDVISPSGPGRPDHYLSANHELDPFTRIDPFRPTSGGWVAPGSRYRDVSGLSDYLLAADVVDWAKDRTNLNKFAALVPHGFTHYMRQPDVVLNLWCSLLSEAPGQWLAVKDAVRKANKAKLREDIAAELKVELSHIVSQAEALEEKTIGSYLKILQRLGGF
jgi:hypothetical protein